MTALRAAVFYAAALAWTAVLAALYLPLLILPRLWLQAGTRFWLNGLLRLTATICGLGYQVTGRQHLPPGAAIIAAKHQSAWDTFVFHQLLPDPVFVLKRELFRIPLVGWYMQRAGSIGIDRGERLAALRQVIADAGSALAANRQVIVFPEGTRVAAGEQRPYRAGVAALYERCRVPVVPVALNSGLFWGRRHFRKRPGRITVEILPPIAPGLDRRAFLDTLQNRIETASQRLARQAAMET
jgi:1-acyl-sn-glycerol-3-phosphate acyltransferase